jgi:hemerythrin superfamily protein
VAFLRVGVRHEAERDERRVDGAEGQTARCRALLTEVHGKPKRVPMANPGQRTEILMSTDAIVILKNDHKTILKTFRAFQAAGDGAHKTKAELVDTMIELLTVHTYIENEVMYPRVRALLPDLEDDVLESYEEHHVADILCAELHAMKPDDERFDAKTTVLIENVTHHIEEEEQDWFPQVREGLGRKQLQELGARMNEMREKAPRSPGQPSALKKAVDAITA